MVPGPGPVPRVQLSQFIMTLSWGQRMAELTEGYHPSLGVRTFPVYDSKQTHKTGTMSHMKGRDGVHCMTKLCSEGTLGLYGADKLVQIAGKRRRLTHSSKCFLLATKLQVLSLFL